MQKVHVIHLRQVENPHGKFSPSGLVEKLDDEGLGRHKKIH